jgi:ORF6N domain
MASRETAPIERSILIVRGQRVILAADLAKIYGVETRVLNQAVKRNRERFPEDFTFRLARDEASAIAASRSQSVILKRGGNIKYLPYVFTEHGAIMAANGRELSGEAVCAQTSCASFRSLRNSENVKVSSES